VTTLVGSVGVTPLEARVTLKELFFFSELLRMAKGQISFLSGAYLYYKNILLRWLGRSTPPLSEIVALNLHYSQGIHT